MIRKWLSKGRPPDALIFESIHHSGGHQGGSVDDIMNGVHQPEEVIGGARKLLDDNGLEDVPVISAGGNMGQGGYLTKSLLGRSGCSDGL